MVSESTLIVAALEGDVRLVDDLADEWRALCDEGPSNLPFYRPEWISAYLNAFEPTARLVVVTARNDGRLRAVLPLIRETVGVGGIGLTRLRTPVNEHSNRFDLVLGAGDTEEVLLAVWRFFAARPDWHLIDIPDVPEDGNWRRVLELADRDGFPIATRPALVSPYLLFPTDGGDVESVLKQLDGQFRYRLRNRMRRLREQGPVELLRFDTDDPTRIEQFYALEGGGWKGQAGTAIVADPRTGAFYDGVARGAAEYGYLSLYLLECNGAPIAGHLGFTLGGRYYMPKVGYDEEFRQFGPGHLIIQEIIRDLLARDVCELDFLGQAMSWKTEWTSAVRLHNRCYLFERGAIGRAAYTARFRAMPLARRTALRTSAGARRLQGTARSMLSHSNQPRPDSATPPSSRLTDSILTVRFVRANQLPTAETIWRSLEDRVGNVRLARSWEWTETWLHHYGDIVPHRFAIGERDGQPVAITLVARGVGRRRGPFPLRTIHLGTAGEPPAQSIYVEGNGLLALPDERERFAGALLKALRSGPWSWDELLLDGFDPDDAAPLLAADPGFGVRTEVCRTFDLAEARRSGGDLLSALRDSVAERVRYNRRRFEAKYGPVRAEWAKDLVTATSIFEDLKELHQARWEGVGEPGVFASPRFAAFHEELIQRLHPVGKIVLFRVSAGDERIGCSYGFVEGTMVVNYQSGMAVFDQRRLSPGTLTNALCLEACLERGYDEYNWLAGDRQSKQDFANAERALVWATLQRGQRVRAIDGTIAVGRQARRLQQQARAVREKQAARPPTSLVRRPLIRGKSEALAQMLTSSRGDRLLRRLPLWTGVLVLNYHRIGDHDASPFDRGVFSATADAFDAHLAFLRKNADVIGLADLPNVLHRGRGRHVLLTFDDGYRDNYELAFPILRAHGLTATFFLCTGFLDDGHPSWWDEIAWMIRTSPLSELPAGPWFPQPIPLDESSREAAISAATTLYKQLPSDRAVAFHHDLAEITKSGRLDAAVAKDLWMSWDMVREMRAAGMTFGGHTVNHPILARLPPERQNAEIAGNAGRIEAELRERPRAFAYPVGHRDCFDATTRTALQAHGFELAFSFYGGAQPFAPFDPYDVRRVAVSHYLSFDLFTVLVTLPMLTGRK